jgi:hypothetical protein
MFPVIPQRVRFMQQRLPIFPVLMRAAAIVLGAALPLVSAPARVHAQQGSCSKACYAKSYQCKRRANESGLTHAQRLKIVEDCLRAEEECVNQRCHGY